MKQVLSWSHETRLLLFMSVDALFAVTTFAFLFLGEQYGDQRNATLRYPRYPGALGLVYRAIKLENLRVIF